MNGTSALGYEQIFLFFFIMLGPAKLLIPFVKLTMQAGEPLRRQLAWRAFWYACGSGLFVALIGQRVIRAWGISVTALIFTVGIILFLVAMHIIMKQYTPSQSPAIEHTAVPSLSAAATPITFPWILTPYGIAALIVILALSPDLTHGIIVIAVFLAVMLLNLLTMLYAHQSLRIIGGTTMLIIGAVLSVLQVALGVELILVAVKRVMAGM